MTIREPEFRNSKPIEAQEEVGEEVEHFLAARISKIQGIEIDPKDLPALIDQEIKKEIEIN